MRKSRRRPLTYTIMHELMAHPTEPMPAHQRTHQLTRMWQAMREVELDAKPTIDAWRFLSDSVNLMESLVVMGEIEDKAGVIHDATVALYDSAKRYKAIGVIRLDGKGITAVRAALEDYAMVLEQLPERVMIRCHRDTEKRLCAIREGKRQSHDVAIV